MAEISVPTNLYCGSLPADSTDEDWLKLAADMGADRVERYETYERWYDGDHKLKLLDRAKLYLEGEGIPYAENFVPVVVDTVANRLIIESVQVTDQDDVTEWMKEQLWPQTRLDLLQGIVHVETVKLGDGCVIAGWDSKRGRPRFSWNRPHLVKFVYSDDGGELIYVVKRWPTTVASVGNPAGSPIWRMNVYFPDRIEKWFSADRKGDSWEKHLDRKVDTDGEDDPNGEYQWPMPWVDAEEEPLGIPAFHFRNNPQGRQLGRSRARGAIPFNRALNKQAIDLFHVMDSQGWKQRWGSGLGETDSIQVAIGEFIKASDKDAKFGEFAAEDPTRLIAAMEGTLTRMSAATGTPLHDLIKGTPPSGEALKTANAARDGDCFSFADVNTPTWVELNRMGWRLESEFGDDPTVPDFDPDADVVVNWAPPSDRSEKEEAEIAESDQRLGVSKRTILIRRGYDPDEEAKFRDEESKASAEAVARTVAASGFGGE